MNLQAYILQLRIQAAQLMLQILRLQAGRVNPDKARVLFETAKACIGKDMAPNENEFGCAEAVNNVFQKAFGVPVGGGLSTYRMYQVLMADKRFKRVFDPTAGDLIISPTGFGNGKIIGHVGIVSENDKIMSNNSSDGLWLENYTVLSWKGRYVFIGGFPMAYYRVISG